MLCLTGLLADEHVRGQLAELTKLSRLQTKALEDSSFVGLSNEERVDYDKRRLRILKPPSFFLRHGLPSMYSERV